MEDASSTLQVNVVAENPESRPFVVGIGASAGGLEALEKLFENMPPDTGMIFVVIQHLSPDFKSLTDTLLARRTAIPIRQAENGMLVAPDVCYLLPPKKDMILSDGRLLLTDKEPAPTVALPIDRFFRSMAQDVGDRAVAVILSGTGSDGSRGIRDIHEVGGLVIVQAPETAKFDGMPKSAIGTSAVDYTLSPEEIPSALLRHAEHPGHRELEVAGGQTDPPVGMDAIFQLLRDTCGIDFLAYKPETVTRRIERRLALLRVGNVEEYADRLISEPGEVNLLYKDLLIGVTRFFRDPEAFELLERDILPKLLATGDRDEEFRVWIAGCATGEEAYSLAVVIQECLERLGKSRPVKIFATDVHRASLDTASAATYSSENLGSVTPERLHRFFVNKGEGYQVVPELRKQVVFAQHNVLKDAPFTKLDLVLCRNLLIYFVASAQKKVLSLFHFGLKAGGILVLGPSEGPGDLADEFDTVNVRWKIYRKRRDVRLPSNIRLSPPVHTVSGQQTSAISPGTITVEPSLLAILDMLLDEGATPGILINERRQIVRTFAGASQFLAMNDGWFSLDVLDSVCSELKPVLAGAVPRAMQENVVVSFKALSVHTAEGNRVIDVRVKPLRAKRSPETFVLISLNFVSEPIAKIHDRELDLGDASRENILSLEADLRSTKESLQATIEELETSNEELQATNEELTASNEELQSTNEELHSVNEELYTVNGEYQKKIEELTELTADMENLLASTDIHTIFLDRNLRIRKFTPKIAETFNLLPQDLGRRIDHFTYTIDYPALVSEIQSVLDTAKPIEEQVLDRRGRWFLLRILPYIQGVAIEGVVMTLVDISRFKLIEAQARDKDRQLATILRNSPNLVFIQDLDGRYLLVDEVFKQIVGCDPIGKTSREVLSSEVAKTLDQQRRRVVAEGAVAETEIVLDHPRGPRTYLLMLFPIKDDGGHLQGLGGIGTDVTQLKNAEYAAREAVAQRDRFLAVLSHELRNPLAAVINALAVIDRAGLNSSLTKSSLAIIERRSRHMATLLEDLLDVARITQNKIEIRKRVFDLNSIIVDVLEESRQAIEERKLTLHLSRDEKPIMILGDPARLHQMQVNLLLNAAKYTPEGGEIWYSVAIINGEVKIRVRDTGVGMKPDLLTRAFDLFVQADETLDRSGGGMGVGLTLVKAIVELHDGKIDAFSDGPGKGCEFTVHLPVARDILVPADRVAEEKEPAPPCRILVVEDDPDIRESLASILCIDGHEVITAEDGPSALIKLEDTPIPDIALVDIGIPVMNGYELARKIRSFKQYGSMRLIALTGYGRPGDRQTAFESGFDAHVTKPFNPREIATLISSNRKPNDR